VKFKSDPIALIQSNIKYYCHLTLPPIYKFNEFCLEQTIFRENDINFLVA